MFKKEAINEKACEHCNEVMCSVCEHKTCDNTHLVTLKCREWRDRRAGFYCGAEFGYNKANEYAKTIIQDLLDNSDEYARQRAMDFLEEKE